MIEYKVFKIRTRRQPESQDGDRAYRPPERYQNVRMSDDALPRQIRGFAVVET